ncbi:hypothetical protein [Litchfieldia alkalitelluris]|uniref:hypothetical protein n=1 Tax=Litchfieldia alkalitelluris TaxID=304268 RepID=UPI000997E7EC|nr:hypothetical protein [Litchfieldia alkalitelluris]
MNSIQSMRRKQLVYTNFLLVLSVFIYFITINILKLQMGLFFLSLGIIIFVQSIYGLLKKNSTKSLIPIYEQVAEYEKEKMGNEWYRQRRMGFLANLVLSGIMFFQAYVNRASTDNMSFLDLRFMLIMMAILLITVNIGLFFHIKKVDRSVSIVDFKGYTCKSFSIAIVVGLVMGVLFTSFTLFFLFISATLSRSQSF